MGAPSRIIDTVIEENWLWGIPPFVVDHLGLEMRVFDELVQSVVFLGVEISGRFVPLGTGFICGVHQNELSFPLLITADHVVDQIRTSHISVRLNRKDGKGTGIIQVPKEARVRHHDAKNDVAIFPFPVVFDVYDVLMFPLNRAHRDEVYKTVWKPGPGDEVHTVGLYTSHHGLTRNIPVVRTGNIAALPPEPVHTERGYIEALLVEVRSIAGLSGSPVYLQIPRIRIAANSTRIQQLNQEMALLIGVMIGYHAVESQEDQISVPQFQSEMQFKETGYGGNATERNTGLAVVVPVDRLFEIIEGEPMKKVFEHAVQHRREHSGFRRTSASAPNTEQASDNSENGPNPDHREDFTRLLNAAVKGSPSKDRT